MIFFGSEETLNHLETFIYHLSVPTSLYPPIGLTSESMDCKRITESFNVNSFNSFNTTITDDRNQVLQWLSPLEPQKRHQHLRGNRLKGVGQWIFRTDEFRRWDARGDGSSHSVLFCHGDPGVGKTHLSSVVIDHFYGKRQDITVAGLYCDYLDRKEQTTSNMLGAMLKQLVGKGTIPEDIRKAFEGAKEHFGGVGPEVSELLQMLRAAIAQRQRVVICIDGLDESLGVHRTGLLRALQAIVRGAPNLRLFLTGRPFIRSEVEKYFPSVDTIPISPREEDIETFLRMKLDEDPEPDAMDERLRVDIMEIIPKKISEIFLLVTLSIDSVLGETTIRRRREKLKQMSSGRDVGDVYAATLERIKAQKKDRARLGMEAIMWVAYSERPLSPEELCEALGVEIGSTDLDSDNVPSIRTILNCGLGLVTVDSSSSVVRLVHFTLQEHVQANPTLFCSPHSLIAVVCLTYLNFGCIRDLSPALRSPPPATPFLEYASRHWGAHARKQTSSSVISLALKLLDGFDAHISCELLLRGEFQKAPNWDVRGYDGPIKCTALHVAAFLGILEIMVSLLKINKWDVNVTDSLGSTALMWAGRMGHDAIAKVLLEQEGVDPNIVDDLGRTPLSWAAESGHKGIVQMLLEQGDVNPDNADKSGRTPLSWAFGQDMWGWASEKCSEIVKILLERNDVNPDSADKRGRTPLSRAARNGYENIVRMLLERADVSPDITDEDGRTPLSWAAGPGIWRGGTNTGSHGVVKILLERNDVNPDSIDKSGGTPISWAAWNGYGGVVQMLLERNDVNPDITDGDGRTPLSWAAGPKHPLAVGEESYKEAVKILLERNNVNPDGADKSGRTPLSWAAGNGRHQMVRMLLERSDVNPCAPDEDGRTPLSWAAGNGREEIAELLLKRGDVNPDYSDKSGRTPLSWAAGDGRERVVKMLLEQNDVNHDTADEDGRTPASWAAKSGHEKIVGMLLLRNDALPNTVDESGQNKFPLATGNDCGRVAQEQGGSHGPPSILGRGVELSGPFATDPSPFPEPPLKKIRRF